LADQSFPKSEKITSKKVIKSVFRNGKQHYQYPLKIFFLDAQASTQEPPLKVLVSVPKKKFKKAVDRNKIKRQLREVFRLNKQQLLDRLQVSEKIARISIVYIAKKAEPYELINKSYQSIINQLPIE